MSDVFTAPDTWAGGSVELLLLLGSVTHSGVLDALEAAWAWPPLDGPYPSNAMEPSAQVQVAIRTLRGADLSPLYGVVTLPSGELAAFASHVIRDEDGAWVYLGMPLGSLSRAYPLGAYPFEGTPLDGWAQEVYRWLGELAAWVFERVPFAGGVIGWLTLIEVDELHEGTVPERRFHGYLVVDGNELRYLPPNVDEPLMTVGR